MTCPYSVPVKKRKDKARLGWTISHKSLHFCHPSLKFVPWFTGMWNSLLFVFDKISLFSLVNHECIDHQVSHSGIECTTNVLFLAAHLVLRAGLSLRGRGRGFSKGSMDVCPGYFQGK